MLLNLFSHLCNKKKYVHFVQLLIRCSEKCLYFYVQFFLFICTPYISVQLKKKKKPVKTKTKCKYSSAHIQWIEANAIRVHSPKHTHTHSKWCENNTKIYRKLSIIDRVNLNKIKSIIIQKLMQFHFNWAIFNHKVKRKK